jgi:hypothetical protein
MKKHYILWYRLDAKDRYLIWFSSQVDGVIVRQKKVQTFENVADLQAFAAAQGIKLVPEEPVLYNFDTVAEWLTDPNQALICTDCMNAWNLVNDLTTTLGMKFKGNLKDNLTLLTYDKICQNTVIPAYEFGAEGGKTNFKDKERRMLTEVMEQAMQLARKLI